MRKLDKKLQLHRETLLQLQRSDLATVPAGANDTADSWPPRRTCSCNSVCQCVS
jgi:hypothetical protein